MEHNDVRPRIMVSRCLGFDACRYDGSILKDDVIQPLKEYVECIDICPEVQAGMGTPRDPIRLVGTPDSTRVIQSSTGKDFTESISAVANNTHQEYPEVDGFILKSRSPSCGLSDTKLYHRVEDPTHKERGMGIFAQRASELFPLASFEDEGRLTNYTVRDHFLNRIYISARFRNLEEKMTMKKLQQFHAQHKFLLMAYEPKSVSLLGKMVSGKESSETSQIFKNYREGFFKAISKPMKKGRVINVLQHSLGYFKKGLEPKEKKWFCAMLEDYRQARLPLHALTKVLYGWTLRFNQQWLGEQIFFHPYPSDLMNVRDSGKMILKT